MHQPEHLVVAAIGAVGNTVGPERARRRPAALVERGQEARLAGDLRHHSGIGHCRHSPRLLLSSTVAAYRLTPSERPVRSGYCLQDGRARSKSPPIQPPLQLSAVGQEISVKQVQLRPRTGRQTRLLPAPYPSAAANSRAARTSISSLPPCRPLRQIFPAIAASMSESSGLGAAVSSAA